jgi:hypothetical protein
MPVVAVVPAHKVPRQTALGSAAVDEVGKVPEASTIGLVALLAI